MTAINLIADRFLLKDTQSIGKEGVLLFRDDKLRFDESTVPTYELRAPKDEYLLSYLRGNFANVEETDDGYLFEECG